MYRSIFAFFTYMMLFRYLQKNPANKTLSEISFKISIFFATDSSTRLRRHWL